MKDSANISHRKAKEVIRVFNTDGTPAARDSALLLCCRSRQHMT